MSARQLSRRRDLKDFPIVLGADKVGCPVQVPITTLHQCCKRFVPIRAGEAEQRGERCAGHDL